MTRWQWLGPAIGAVFFVAGLTGLVLAPFEDVFFGFSDPVKFALTMVVAAGVVAIIVEVQRRRRRRLRAADATITAWLEDHGS